MEVSMRAVFTVLVTLLCCRHCHADGAGRAFSVESENYVIEQFRTINPTIQWDETNFLVDLAGLYANCKWIGTSDFVYVDRVTPDDVTIAAFTDDIPSQENHVEATVLAIKDVVSMWMVFPTSDIYQQIEASDTFGCSVRPGCNGRVSVACLFSPELRPTKGLEGSGTSIVTPGGPEDDEDCMTFDLDGRAFTPEQYRVAESRVGVHWDRDHFLENMSGVEITCDMVGAARWNFTKVEAAFKDVNVTPLFGSARNEGETEPAMVQVLDRFNGVLAQKMGCSILPDCMKNNEMWVVVCCIFQM